MVRELVCDNPPGSIVCANYSGILTLASARTGPAAGLPLVRSSSLSLSANAGPKTERTNGRVVEKGVPRLKYYP